MSEQPMECAKVAAAHTASSSSSLVPNMKKRSKLSKYDITLRLQPIVDVIIDMDSRKLFRTKPFDIAVFGARFISEYSEKVTTLVEIRERLKREKYRHFRTVCDDVTHLFASVMDTCEHAHDDLYRYTSFLLDRFNELIDKKCDDERILNKISEKEWLGHFERKKRRMIADDYRIKNLQSEVKELKNMLHQISIDVKNTSSSSSSSSKSKTIKTPKSLEIQTSSNVILAPAVPIVHQSTTTTTTTTKAHIVQSKSQQQPPPSIAKPQPQLQRQPQPQPDPTSPTSPVYSSSETHSVGSNNNNNTNNVSTGVAKERIRGFSLNEKRTIVEKINLLPPQDLTDIGTMLSTEYPEGLVTNDEGDVYISDIMEMPTRVLSKIRAIIVDSEKRNKIRKRPGRKPKPKE